MKKKKMTFPKQVLSLNDYDVTKRNYYINININNSMHTNVSLYIIKPSKCSHLSSMIPQETLIATASTAGQGNLGPLPLALRPKRDHVVKLQLAQNQQLRAT
jgi:hypothetical protein